MFYRLMLNHTYLNSSNYTQNAEFFTHKSSTTYNFSSEIIYNFYGDETWGCLINTAGLVEVDIGIASHYDMLLFLHQIPCRHYRHCDWY